jgi:hypothetical protein
MRDILRDSTAGQIINYLSGRRLLPYADQVPGYVIPERYRQHMLNVSTATITDKSLQLQPKETESPNNVSNIDLPSIPTPSADAPVLTLYSEPMVMAKLHPQFAMAGDFHLVGWDGPDDQDNPRWVLILGQLSPALLTTPTYRCWSLSKRLFVGFSIAFLGFAGESGLSASQFCG